MRDNNNVDRTSENKSNPSDEVFSLSKASLHDDQEIKVSEDIIKEEKSAAASEFDEDNNDCDKKISESKLPMDCDCEVFVPEKEQSNVPFAQDQKLSDFKLITPVDEKTAEQGCFKPQEDNKVQSASEVHSRQNENDTVSIPREESASLFVNDHPIPEKINNTQLSSKCDEIMKVDTTTNQYSSSIQSHIPIEGSSAFSNAFEIQDKNHINSHHSNLLQSENTSKTSFQCGVFNSNSDLIGRGSPVGGLETLKPGVLSNSQIESKDPLETLANAALSDHANIHRKTNEEPTVKEPNWCDVGIFKGNSCHVTSYYAPLVRDPDHNNITSDNLPDYSNALKIDLEPGTAYKFRLCAVNSCGRGPWSEVSAFRTSLPGYPGAPSSVAISRSAEGAHLSWQPPSNTAGTIIEYTVCLAVKNPTQVYNVHTGQKLTLIKVYTGPHTQTIISNSCLSEAHIDTTSKPAIIFRIAARNEKGFGPPTQVRWLQDVVDPHITGVKI